MEPGPGVTVVIPTRNRLAYLQESVASVQRQTFRDWRLVVVDDASDDGTSGWIERLGDDRISVLRMPVRSERSKARNRGLEAAETAFVLFLDDDDLLDPRALEHLVSQLRRSSDAVAAAGGCVYFDDDGHERKRPHPRRSFERSLWLELVFGWVVQCPLLRAEAVRAVGGFSEHLVMGEDRDLWLRLSRLGSSIVIPQTVTRVRVHTGQWRPMDAEMREASINERALEQVDERSRRAGERAVEFRRNYDDAYTALNSSRYTEALRLFASARRAPPSLITSPLIRPQLARGFARALVGSLLGERGRDLVRSVRARGRSSSSAVDDETWRVPAPRRIDIEGD